jgi:hypothetical protein
MDNALRIGLRVVQLLLAAVAVLLVVRGLLYGFVDPGPYDGAWGGPSRAGAWRMHALIAVPLGALTAGLFLGTRRLRRRLARQERGEPAAWWVRPAAVTACVAAALFVAAWTRQL